jgi:putative DNA primase/helicase
MIHDAIEAAAHEHLFHSIRQWLRGLPAWEGEVEPETFFQDYFGVDDHNNVDLKEYLKQVAIMFMVSAIARIFEPGCQVDHMVVLGGGQGIAKSTGLRALFGSDNFTDHMPKSLDSKDSSLQLDGKWCIEFSEIARLIRQDPDTVKAFLIYPNLRRHHHS